MSRWKCISSESARSPSRATSPSGRRGRRATPHAPAVSFPARIRSTAGTTAASSPSPASARRPAASAGSTARGGSFRSRSTRWRSSRALEPLQRGVERALSDLERVHGQLLDPLADRPSRASAPGRASSGRAGPVCPAGPQAAELGIDLRDTLLRQSTGRCHAPVECEEEYRLEGARRHGPLGIWCPPCDSQGTDSAEPDRARGA